MQLLVTTQNGNEVNRKTLPPQASSSLCDSTKHNGLVTYINTKNPAISCNDIIACFRSWSKTKFRFLDPNPTLIKFCKKPFYCRKRSERWLACSSGSPLCSRRWIIQGCDQTLLWICWIFQVKLWNFFFWKTRAENATGLKLGNGLATALNRGGGDVY